MIVKNIKTKRVLTLDEFCEVCDGVGLIETAEDYEKIAEPLVALANNESLLLDFLCKQLSCIESYQVDNTYNVQSIALSRRENYDVRMNFWPSSFDYDLEDKHIKDFFAYDFPHDHNFHFITTGYTRHGYFTHIYDYDYDLFEVGDSVKLNHVGHYELAKGRVMIYEKSKDVHTQFPPEAMAISINVIPKQVNKNNQYVFNVNESKISAIVEEGSPLHSLSFILSKLGNKDLVDLFEARFG